MWLLSLTLRLFLSRCNLQLAARSLYSLSRRPTGPGLRLSHLSRAPLAHKLPAVMSAQLDKLDVEDGLPVAGAFNPMAAAIRSLIAFTCRDFRNSLLDQAALT